MTRATSTPLDVMPERSIDDYWNVDGDRELSDTWTGFTRFTTLDEKNRMDIRGPETDKKANPRLFVARILESYVGSVEAKRNAKVSYRKTEARQCLKIAWYLLH